MKLDIQDEQCAAIRMKRIGKIFRGRRHCHAIQEAGKTFPNMNHSFFEQGFMSTCGRFLTRKEAYAVAVKTGLIEHNRSSHGVLCSEDLY